LLKLKLFRKNWIRLAILVITILLIPLVAMQFTNEVNWDKIDFVVAGLLLYILGALILFAASKPINKNTKLLVIVSAIIIILLIWMELAVGIFNTPFGSN